MRLNKNNSNSYQVFAWGLYAATISLGLYTFPFSALVICGHGVYIWMLDRFRYTQALAAYLLALLVSSITFVPWLLIVINHSSQLDKTLGWTNLALPFSTRLRVWARSLSCSFIDFNVDSESPLSTLLIFGVLVLFLLLLISYSIYFLIRTASKPQWLFIITLIGVTGLVVVLPDLILGGRRSTTPRYLIPCFLGIQLAVAYLLAKKLNVVAFNFRQKQLWQVVTVILLMCETLSCAASYPTEGWWHKSMSYGIPQVGRMINKAAQPLVISDATVADLLSLSYYLEPKVKLQVEPRCYTCHIDLQVDDKPTLSHVTNSFGEVFLFKPRPSEVWLQALHKEKSDKLEPLYEAETGVLLWRLRNNSS